MSSKEDENDSCKDTMQYCPTMHKYCDNADYQGVRLYCRKTCESCDEELEPAEATNSTATNGNHWKFS